MITTPLSLYIHIPWCEKKCPYCDFNSHEHFDPSVEHPYLEALKRDLAQQVNWTGDRPISTIFIGGGTPSLFSGAAITELLQSVRSMLNVSEDAEVTLESNPGSRDAKRYADYRKAGVNRLSIGVQSFDNEQLTALGRIHSQSEALDAISLAKRAGFTRLNIDLMHGLPNQLPAKAFADLSAAIDAGVSHISWYQLTIERNTSFWNSPPRLPTEDDLDAIHRSGLKTLEQAGYSQYEVSAWALEGQECQHNLNYWLFGDYLAIGAGAHGKITDHSGQVFRFNRTRVPAHYIAQFEDDSVAISATSLNPIAPDELLGEFMMNALRLRQGFDISLVRDRLGLSIQRGRELCEPLVNRGLLEWSGSSQIKPTQLGYQHLDTLVAEFL